MKTKIFLLMALAVSSMTIHAQTRRQPRAARAKAVKTANAQATPYHSAQAKALFDEMLPNTQKVFVIDSIVTDKDKTLEAIPLPTSYGKFVRYDKFFGKQNGNNSYVFVNGFGNRCYYTEIGTDSISRLYMCDRVGNAWGTPHAIKSINDNFADISFPFMSSDGQTLYFAGVSKKEGLGQHDIYMAKLDPDAGEFLQAENIGLPFNSYADDYAYVVADADKMAWFASTRNQPEGKTCVYTFVPSDTRQNYNQDEMDTKKLERLAMLTRIRETWPTPEIRDKAMARLAAIKKQTTQGSGQAGSINFVIDDNTTYTSVEQFRSSKAKQAFYETEKMRGNITAAQDKLDKLRVQYHNANASGKQTLGQQILQKEQQLSAARQQLSKAENALRMQERQSK